MNFKSNTKKSLRDYWETPAWLLDWVLKNFPCDVDLACTKENCKFPNGIYYPEHDALKANWHDFGTFGFCNPPYSKIGPWLERAIIHQMEGFGSVWVLPAPNGAQWAKDLINGADELAFITGRVSFIHPETKQPVNQNMGGTVIAAYHVNWPHREKKVYAVNRDELINAYSEVA